MTNNNTVWTILAVQIMLHNLTGRFPPYTAVARCVRILSSHVRRVRSMIPRVTPTL